MKEQCYCIFPKCQREGCLHGVVWVFQLWVWSCSFTRGIVSLNDSKISSCLLIQEKKHELHWGFKQDEDNVLDWSRVRFLFCWLLLFWLLALWLLVLLWFCVVGGSTWSWTSIVEDVTLQFLSYYFNWLSCILI